MAILRITESFENYKQFETDLEFTTNQITEKLYVVLYKRKLDIAGFAKRIEKKPKVVFLLPNNKEIPKRKWTKEMKEKSLEYAQEFPVLNHGKKLTTAGKVFYSAFGVLILGLCLTVAYYAIFNAPELKNKKANFSELPKVGDKYYGAFYKSPTKNTAFFSTHSWIKIIAINVNDSICTYQLSTKPGKHTFNTIEEEHDNFSSDILLGKFSYDEKVKFKSADKSVRFEIGVINNDFQNYKISAK